MNVPLTGVLAVVVQDVPVDPDAPTARRWALDELQQPEYHSSPSLLSRLLTWLQEQLATVPSLGLPTGMSLLIALGVAVALALAILWFVGPVRRSRRPGGGARAVLSSDDTRTAAQLRAAADAAATQGDWHQATLERFRAVVRDLEERTVLEERPGRTAHEAVSAAAVRLPTLDADLRVAGDLFDGVAYGGVAATAEDDARLRDVDARVRATRPTSPSREPSDHPAVPA
ncbi:DUF4129 domain-containing protein [Cellulomonas biazotea]|uniref:DUF4129 domain-containing protein n=2 Tax=Cellulomonas biazotea TaxID=1709 RepID=UPI0035EA9F95